jgi:hypothetical protein
MITKLRNDRVMINKRVAFPIVIFSGAGLVLWNQLYTKNINSQKANSSLFKAVVFHLRHSNIVRNQVGQKIRYEEGKRIDGEINAIKGTADFRFPVAGSEECAFVEYIGHRTNEGNQWISDKFCLIKKDGTVVSLKDEKVDYA